MTTIRESLAREAADAQARRDEPPGPLHRARPAAAETSQVYTVRMPSGRLAQLRAMADETGEAPSALMRRWVLERLDAENAQDTGLDDVRRTLVHALHAVDQLTGKRSA